MTLWQDIYEAQPPNNVTMCTWVGLIALKAYHTTITLWTWDSIGVMEMLMNNQNLIVCFISAMSRQGTIYGLSDGGINPSTHVVFWDVFDVPLLCWGL